MSSLKQNGKNKAITGRTAFRIAHEYCLVHFAPAFTGGKPHHLSLLERDVWIVPILLTSPGYGKVGEVGLIAIDAGNGRILSATPRRAVFNAGLRLDKEKHHELETAFHRARGKIHVRSRVLANASGTVRNPRK